jgi:hypothetical protein
MVSMGKSKQELIEEYSDAELVSLDNPNLTEKITNNGDDIIQLKEYGITIKNEHWDYKAHYVLKDAKENAPTDNQELIGTFTRFFTKVDGDKYEMDIGGPIRVVIPNAAEVLDLE